MNNPIQCDVILRSSAVHLSQLFTGMGMLEQSGLINVRIIKSPDYFPNAPQRLRVIIAEGIKIIFDCRDAVSIDQEDLEWSDFYFKRSYHKDHQPISKIHPLGLNYAAYGDWDYSEIIRKHNFRYWNKNLKKSRTAFKSVVRTCGILGKLLKQDVGRGVSDYTLFECKPKITVDPLVLFQFRLWDPSSLECDSKEDYQEREFINTMRINCLTLLRKEFADQFIGGIAPTSYSKEKYPQLTIPERDTNKIGYIKRFHNSSICVTTMGLHGSNGWKLAEYVAGSKAIVSEHLKFIVPGNFLDGRNYLGFSTPEECVEKVAYLIDNPEERYEMMVNNMNYYHQYLRPDRLVWNAFSTTINLS